ncbi:hypothetical protein [Truepera radiovictrix]|uniref:HNH domain-containing protein n=1 Tax=Truepera radiovictrix (strain DSM 17093 / CIP 108686 / LMG 22925 / RQ-24) TaxID=649638 RepID=D7CTT1_TRURR|nr:hypothetical protein [Truepera radiovictrix]ADI15628.1 conserved hypothetical protein [Truepera radiovictrix DSM 17093]WMT58742.1 hypothetical protein RCV51_07295 [Truepera radiovictrix]
MSPAPKQGEGGARCELCGREQPLTFHHLIPKRNHRKGAFQRRFSKEEMRRRGLMLCRLCHRQLHKTFSERELGLTLNTKEAILEHPEVQRFLAWARKQR